MKFFIVMLLLVVSSGVARAQECTLAVDIHSVISAATNDYLERAENLAHENKCKALLLRINTPGGDLQSTRKIVERILQNKISYLCLISPEGGHAGSAGAMLMLACHVSGGLAATTLGAATPILGTGQNLSQDLRSKIINDTVSWTESLAKIRNRNLQFAKEIVTDAKSIGIEEAVKIKAVDIFASDEKDFLVKAKEKISLETGSVLEFKPDMREKILSLVADPEVAYLLFMASLALIYFEVTHSGFIAPGVFGGMGLVLSLIALQKLEVQWGGLALIILGIAFLIAELFVTSFGILGIGGIVSIVCGSLFLFDTAHTGYALPLSLILGVALALTTVFLGLGFLVIRTVKRKTRASGPLFDMGKVTFVDSSLKIGQVEIGGELWRFEAAENCQIGDIVRVKSRLGLTLKIEKEKT